VSTSLKARCRSRWTISIAAKISISLCFAKKAC
jgi:hypothetical protein